MNEHTTSEPPGQATGGETDPRERFERAAAEKQTAADSPEETLWTGSYSHLAMVGTWVAGGVATLGAILVAILTQASGGVWLWGLVAIGLMWLVMAATYGYRRLSVHYTLTTQRLLHEAGILWRTVDRVELIDIDDVTFIQGPVERILRVGTVVVSSSDVTNPELRLAGIESVRKVADTIDDARRKERRSRGLHIESV